MCIELAYDGMSGWLPACPQGTLEVVSSPTLPPTRRRRNVLELYLRAYWHTYTLALGWVIGVQILIGMALGGR